MEIHDRLKKERERLGLTQTAFGALGGAGKTTVIAWERGTAFPNAAFLAAVAAAGADVRYIVTGDRDGPPPEVLSAEERELLALYRAAPLAVKMAAVGALHHGGAVAPAKTTKQVQKITGNKGQVTQSGKIVNKGGKGP